MVRLRSCVHPAAAVVPIIMGLALALCVPLHHPAVAQIVHFDAPGFVECHPTENPQFRSDPAVERLIRVDVEIAVGLKSQSGSDSISTLVFQVAPVERDLILFDFAPRNLEDSRVEGLVSVESAREKSASLGLGAEFPIQIADVDFNTGLNGKQAQTLRYSEKPQLHSVVTSGFFARRTGAYFKFHKSLQPTLEGTYCVTLILRAPAEWRTGMLRLQVSAVRTSQGLFADDEAKVAARENFLVPIFMAGDREALELATTYQAAEVRFRQAAALAVRRNQPHDLSHQLRGLFAHESPPPQCNQRWFNEMLLTLEPGVADKYSLPKDLSLALKELQVQKQRFVRMAASNDQQVSRQ